MIDRHKLDVLRRALRRQAAVALLGPRQVGKTTLALALTDEFNALYLDLEDKTDRVKLADPTYFLSQFEDRLVILDEIHHAPELFQALRGIIDKGRRTGKGKGRFLLLGSTAIDLLRQTGESLAGRIAYIDLGPIHVLECGAADLDTETLWLRGGFPDSLLAANDEESLMLRKDFIRTYLERDVAMFGPRIPAETLERLWTMLAHGQGTLLNASRLAGNLAISASTVTRYIDLLSDLLLVRRLQPYHGNIGKRLIKSPKTYVRDSGLLHALLGIPDQNSLLGHPVVGASWEGFVIENLIATAPDRTHTSFYRTSAGAEIDLFFELPGGQRWAIEIKLGLNPKTGRGVHHAREDLEPDRTFVVYSGKERYRTTDGLEVTGLRELAQELAVQDTTGAT